MKGIDIFCASQASTAIRMGTTTMEEGLGLGQQGSSSSSSSSSSSISTVIHPGDSRAIDRHNPIIRDPKRFTPPCSAHQHPISPLPYTQLHHHHHNNKKGGSGGGGGRSSLKSKSKLKSESKSKLKQKSKPIDDNNQKRKSSSSSSSSSAAAAAKGIDNGGDNPSGLIVRKNSSSARFGDFVTLTPPGSSRYLLSDHHHHHHHAAFLDVLSDFDPVLALVPVESENNNKTRAQHDQKKPIDHHQSSVPKSSASPDQVVVVLRVSLHCRGCEGKVRKHISRMKGVTSYNIDFAAKKVTVIGDVTPLGVLASVSKVKSAQLWTPSMSSSSSSDIKKHKVGGNDAAK